MENIVFLGRPFGAPLAPPLLYASTTLPMQGLSASAGNANGIAPTLLYYFRYTSAALPSRLSGDRFDRAYLGSQMLCGELSLPVIERSIAAGLAPPPTKRPIWRLWARIVPSLPPSFCGSCHSRSQDYGYRGPHVSVPHFRPPG